MVRKSIDNNLEKKKVLISWHIIYLWGHLNVLKGIINVMTTGN